MFMFAASDHQHQQQHGIHMRCVVCANAFLFRYSYYSAIEWKSEPTSPRLLPVACLREYESTPNPNRCSF